MKKVILIFGTRPEAIKMLPVYLELKKLNFIKPIICLTGQHKELIDPVMKIFGVKEDYNLGVMKNNQTLFSLSSKIMMGLEKYLTNENPDLVLVHGDTTSSAIAALSAFYLKIPIGHIEAGLRSFDPYSPFPEEMNRNITSKLATYHFSPTNTSKKNLLNEGINESKIFVTGNTCIDALGYILGKENILKSDKNAGYDLSNKSNKKIVLITGHRRENFGENFENILGAIKELSLKFPEVDFVYPMHLNPNIRKPIQKFFNNSDLKNIYFIEPLNYFDFVFFMQKSYIVLTDSGGIQEEAPSLGKPVLVMRENTERPEGISAGTCLLVGSNQKLIVSTISKLLKDENYYDEMSAIKNPYGDGDAASSIVKHCEEILLKG
jgi:UDP-N-acetylglucosamine 2-epimerase (non-hydrolysing)